MSEHNQRELRIRLCALRLRYQRAWLAQAGRYADRNRVGPSASGFRQSRA